MSEFLVGFRNTIESSARALTIITEEQSSVAPAPGKWSPKQVIGHLIDSAANNQGRFVKAQLQDELVFPGYRQEEWVTLQRYQDEPWTRLIELWRLYNLHIAHVMSQVPEEILSRPRLHHNLNEIAWKSVPQSEPVTLDYFMKDYVGHLKHHLRQIIDEVQ